MTRLVNIAFQGGTHGAYLRYCIDKFSANTPMLTGSPFTSNRTAHDERQKSDLVHKYHPTLDAPHFYNVEEPHILITVDHDDILFIERWITLRSGDFGIDTDRDEIRFSDQFLEYFTWAGKFQAYYKIDLHTQSVPRYILRDFYKLSFLDDNKNGFLKNDRILRANAPRNTFFFPVGDFWHKESFAKKIKECGDVLGLNLDLSDLSVHDEFLKNLHHLDTRERASRIITAIKEGEDVSMSDLDTVEQAFVSAWIEKNFDFITVPLTNNFFTTTGELVKWLDNYPEHYKAMNPNLPKFNGIDNPFHLWDKKK